MDSTDEEFDESGLVEDINESEVLDDELDEELYNKPSAVGHIDLEICKKLELYISRKDTTCENCGLLPEAHDRIDPPPRWSYTPLQDETEIRLLVIRPPIVGRESEMYGKLIHCNLHGDKKPRRPLIEFEAVSYTWRDFDIWRPNSDMDLGNPPPLDSIIHLDGSALKVTSNCLAALRRIRLMARARVVWIDSICVNQDDLDERGHQVRLMAEIYTIARRVLIYPGKPSDEGELGLQYIAELDYRKIDLTKDYWQRRATIDTIRDLFKQPYFYRVWILQEITLAREAIVFYGRLEIPLDYLSPQRPLGFNGDLQPTRSLSTILEAVPNRPRLLNLHQRAAWNDILDLLEVTRECAATDPRDKVFSLYGMLPLTADQEDFAPNYRETVHQTYTRTAVGLARAHGVMPVLVRAVFPGKMENLPAWVPDWMVPSLPTFQARAMAENQGLVAKVVADRTDPYSFETTGYPVCSLEGLVSLGFSVVVSTPTINERRCVKEQDVHELYTELHLGKGEKSLWCYLLEQQTASGTPRGGKHSGILLLSDGGSTFNFAGLCRYRAPILGTAASREKADAILSMAARCSGPFKLLVDRVAEILCKTAMTVERAEDHETHLSPDLGLRPCAPFPTRNLMVAIDTLCRPIGRGIYWTIESSLRMWFGFVEQDHQTDLWQEMLESYVHRLRAGPQFLDDRARPLFVVLREFSSEDILAEVKRRLQFSLVLALDRSVLKRCHDKQSPLYRYSPLTDILEAERLRFEANLSKD